MKKSSVMLLFAGLLCVAMGYASKAREIFKPRQLWLAWRIFRLSRGKTKQESKQYRQALGWCFKHRNMIKNQNLEFDGYVFQGPDTFWLAAATKNPVLWEYVPQIFDLYTQSIKVDYKKLREFQCEQKQNPELRLTYSNDYPVIERLCERIEKQEPNDKNRLEVDPSIFNKMKFDIKNGKKERDYLMMYSELHGRDLNDKSRYGLLKSGSLHGWIPKDKDWIVEYVNDPEKND